MTNEANDHGSNNLQNSASFDRVKEVQYRVHQLRVVVNGISFTQVMIDTHYEEKHKASMSDEIILGLVMELNRRNFLLEAMDSSGRNFFVNEPWLFKNKWYRLVWFIPKDESYLGVRNAFRSRLRGKDGN